MKLYLGNNTKHEINILYLAQCDECNMSSDFFVTTNNVMSGKCFLGAMLMEKLKALEVHIQTIGKTGATERSFGNGRDTESLTPALQLSL